MRCPALFEQHKYPESCARVSLLRVWHLGLCRPATRHPGYIYIAGSAFCRQRRSVLLGLPVFSPVGRVARWWSILTTLLDLTYTAFLVPLSVAFLTQDWDVHSRLNFLVVSDLIGSKSGLVLGGESSELLCTQKAHSGAWSGLCMPVAARHGCCLARDVMPGSFFRCLNPGFQLKTSCMPRRHCLPGRSADGLPSGVCGPVGCSMGGRH